MLFLLDKIIIIWKKKKTNVLLAARITNWDTFVFANLYTSDFSYMREKNVSKRFIALQVIRFVFSVLFIFSISFAKLLKWFVFNEKSWNSVTRDTLIHRIIRLLCGKTVASKNPIQFSFNFTFIFFFSLNFSNLQKTRDCLSYS